jgi:hypothetical protein
VTYNEATSTAAVLPDNYTSHTDTDFITHTSSLMIWHWHGLALYILIWAVSLVSGEKTVKFVLD